MMVTIESIRRSARYLAYITAGAAVCAAFVYLGVRISTSGNDTGGYIITAAWVGTVATSVAFIRSPRRAGIGWALLSGSLVALVLVVSVIIVYGMLVGRYAE